jgi:hypothetical protein
MGEGNFIFQKLIAGYARPFPDAHPQQKNAIAPPTTQSPLRLLHQTPFPLKLSLHPSPSALIAQQCSTAEVPKASKVPSGI